MTKLQGDPFRVTVSRINEGLHDEPYITFEAHTVVVSPDGRLSITSEKGRIFSAGSWDGFELKRK